jgi:26S proteasome regulatory subunit N6
MSSIAELLSQAEKCSSSNPTQAEDLYKKILHNTSGKSRLLALINLPIFETASTSKEPPRDEDQAQNLRDQEIALVKLGELYRDQK